MSKQTGRNIGLLLATLVLMTATLLEVVIYRLRMDAVNVAVRAMFTNSRGLIKMNLGTG